MPPRRPERTISGIERQKKRRNRVSIWLDGEYAFSLDLETASRFGLRTGDSYADDRILEIRRAGEEEETRLAALRFLRTRMRSEHELRTKLSSLATEADVIDRVILRLRRGGLVDDRKFAESYVHDLALRGTAGIRMLRHRLRQKGIPNELIESTLRQLSTIDEQTALAKTSAQRFLRRHPRPAPEQLMKLQRHLAQYLGRRGFDWAIITVVIRSFPLFRNAPQGED